MKRNSTIIRETAETKVSLELNLDGQGNAEINTGVGFLDHMLVLMTKHGLMDFKCYCKGDTYVDDHHTVEDVGICFGKAIAEALDDKKSIRRYSTFYIPMDEALVRISIDISGRAFIVFNTSFPTSKVGNFDTELIEEFFRAVAVNAGITIHIEVLYGKNVHHMIEAMFKAFGRALNEAVSIDEKITGVPSSKGIL